MSIEVTTIPKEPQWEDIVIDADKNFNWHTINHLTANLVFLRHSFLATSLNANNHKIVNLGAPTQKGNALSLGNPIPVSAGNAPFSFNDATRTTNSTTMIKLKETRIWRSGEYRINFWMRSRTEGIRVRGRIYRNGTPIGTERSTTSLEWFDWTEDIHGWESGDFVQIYARSPSSAHQVEVKNLRLFVHESNITEEIM